VTAFGSAGIATPKLPASRATTLCASSSNPSTAASVDEIAMREVDDHVECLDPRSGEHSLEQLVPTQVVLTNERDDRNRGGLGVDGLVHS
jgi:hypothetical protein